MATHNYRQIRDALRKREAFTGNSMSGQRGNRLGQRLTGQLDGHERRQFVADASRGIAYVVLSYSTPIGWTTRDGDSYVTSQKFSTTTSRHQGLARAYL